MEQRTADRSNAMSNGELITANRAQVLQSFKRDALAPAAGAVMTIVQFGGVIDRGEHLDRHIYNRLPPLNVGDEYVAFLYRSETGEYGIHGAEEGAFSIRNGRVYPAGTGGVATAWNGRAAAKFFEALQVTTQVPTRGQ